MTIYRPIIVLDDDPTGTQTVNSLPVITDWSIELLTSEREKQTPIFFILTNSRAFIASKAEKIAIEIGENIAQVFNEYWLISRGDSTLRGHYPIETNALAKGCGYDTDFLTIICPAFFEGKRYTKNDIHFLLENNIETPVSESPYALDSTFGYKNSNLREWVKEKTKGKINDSQIDSISLELLDKKNDAELAKKIENPATNALIINAVNKEQLDYFSEQAKYSKRQIIFRTGASFVASFGNIEPKPLLTKSNFNFNQKSPVLIVVGSHTPKTNDQLIALLSSNITSKEFDVEQFMLLKEDYIESFSKNINEILNTGNDLVIYTSRRLLKDSTAEKDLLLSVSISKSLVEIVNNIVIQLRVIIAKGGITSSDIATDALNIKRAQVLGQILPGVPVWLTGDESKFPGSAFIIFPGNVGEKDDLLKAYLTLKD